MFVCELSGAFAGGAHLKIESSVQPIRFAIERDLFGGGKRGEGFVVLLLLVPGEAGQKLQRKFCFKTLSSRIECLHRLVTVSGRDVRAGEIVVRLFDGGVRGDGFGEAVYRVRPAFLVKRKAAEKIMRRCVLWVFAQDGFDLFLCARVIAASQKNIHEFGA